MTRTTADGLRAQITHLEAQLESSKAELDKLEHHGIDQQPSISEPAINGFTHEDDAQTPNHLTTTPALNKPISRPISPSLTHLLLLSDSALPIGSFAYSSGLESFLVHSKAKYSSTTSTIESTTTSTLFRTKFLPLSLLSLSTTQIPYLISSYHYPSHLRTLDNDLDASTPCTVARRASTSQGRALLSVWEKSFSPSLSPSTSTQARSSAAEATAALRSFSRDLKISSLSNDSLGVNGHFAPLFGAISLSLSLSLHDAAFLLLFNHAKAVTSAAVRASVMGPYMAQSILASGELRGMIKAALERVSQTSVEDAGQSVPVMDLWLGRHEMLYSRIFNS